MDETEQKFYTAGSSQVAVRTVTGGQDTLTWILSDHLGSASVTANADGTFSSEIRYTAFGEVRYSSGSVETPYQYTGQLSQMEEIGLYYFVARWMDPVTAHFVQADTIVPGPGKVTILDRYAYVHNAPINYNDPTGHRDCDTINGYNCDATNNDVRQELEKTYHWTFEDDWLISQMMAFLDVGMKIESYIDDGLYRGAGWIRNNLGNAVFHHNDGIDSNKGPCNYVFPKYDVNIVRNQVLEPETIAHELGHVLDSNSAGFLPATIFGGGLADELFIDLGGNPRIYFPRFWWTEGVELPEEHQWPKGHYGNMNPADYFAETFANALYHPEIVPVGAKAWLDVNLAD